MGMSKCDPHIGFTQQQNTPTTQHVESEQGLSNYRDYEPLLLRVTMESVHRARSHQHLWAFGKQIETPSRKPPPSGFGSMNPSALLWSCY